MAGVLLALAAHRVGAFGATAASPRLLHWQASTSLWPVLAPSIRGDFVGQATISAPSFTGVACITGVSTRDARPCFLHTWAPKSKKLRRPMTLSSLISTTLKAVSVSLLTSLAAHAAYFTWEMVELPASSGASCGNGTPYRFFVN